MEELFFEALNEKEISAICENLIELEEGVIFEKIGEVQNLTDIAESDDDYIVGDYKEAMEHWTMQTEENSCVITQEISVIEQLENIDLSEEKMLEIAKMQGFYDGGRISEGDCGKLLEYFGFNVEKAEGLTLNDLVGELSSGSKVICGVNGGVLYNPELSEMPGIKANHVVQVIGVDLSDKENIKVIMNDSGIENGRGIAVDADSFIKAWNTSDNFTVTASKGV